MTRVASAILLILVGAGLHALTMQKPTPGGYVIEHDAEVAKTEPGTHNGGGQTVGIRFINVPKLGLVFRKRALKPGSGIGLHEQRRTSSIRPQRHRHDDTGREDRERHPGYAISPRPGKRTACGRLAARTSNPDQLRGRPAR